MRTEPSRPSREAIRRSRPRFSAGEVLLLVAGRDAALRRLDPDLQEMHRLVFEALNSLWRTPVPALMRCTSPGRITEPLPICPVLERAVEHVADDLHVAVAVGAEAGARLPPGPR
jgi:hypothetical protein